MSESQASDQSYETTSAESENGESPRADQSSVGESTEFEEPEQGLADAEQETEAILSKQGHSRDQNPKASSSSASAQSRKCRKEQLNGSSWKGYRDLLNESIQEVLTGCNAPEEPLAPSQIGASYWTSSEKGIFFRELAVSGPRELHSLSTAIRSKSEAEVHAYLKLLQEGVAQVNALSANQHTPSTVEDDASYEIGEECVAALESEADSLAWRLLKRDMQLEQKKYGDDWLIDAVYAAHIERGLQGKRESDTSDVNQDGHGNGGDDADRDMPNVAPFHAAGLLRPEAFIQLSQDIFMSGSPGDGLRWYESANHIDSISGPAIFRTAFEDFYNLTLSLARRLIQTTLFQTMTRLRASDAARTNWQPKPEVTKVDVKTALKILGCDPDGWTNYWARLPRKAGLEVYSDSKKYKDGRPGTKNGAKLNFEEAEEELGLSPTLTMHGRSNGDNDDDSQRLHAIEFDSDDFTIISEERLSSPGSTDMAYNDVGNPESDIAENEPASRDSSVVTNSEKGSVPTNQDSTSGHNDWPTRKGKQALSPAFIARAEDLSFDGGDRESSRQEERRLWKEVLKQEPSQRPDRDDAKGAEWLPRKYFNSNEVPNWTDKVNYEAAWERLGEPIKESQFTEMGRLGRLGRKRRRELRETMMLDRSSNAASDLIETAHSEMDYHSQSKRRAMGQGASNGLSDKDLDTE